MKLKKGQADVVGWVLLVGLAVTLAVFVGRWAIQQSQQSTDIVVEGVEIDLKCANVAIAGSCIGDVGNRKIKIENMGSVKVGYKVFNIQDCLALNKIEIDPEGNEALKIGGIDSSKVLNNCKYARIIPLVKIKKKNVACSEKEIEVNCI